MSNIVTTKALALAAFKALIAVAAIDVFKARKSGNLYGTDSEGNLVCSFAGDIKLDEPMVVLHQLNTKDKSEWWFVINGEHTERKALATV